LLVFCTSAVFANTQAISGLYNTGQDNSHNALASGAVDPHYDLQANPYDGSANAFAVNRYSSWVAPASSNTKWITPCVAGANPCENDHDTVHAGHYIYDLTFNLDAGYSYASISGSWAADNNATMYINGFQVTNGGTTPTVGMTSLSNPVRGFFTQLLNPSHACNPGGARAFVASRQPRPMLRERGNRSSVSRLPRRLTLAERPFSRPFRNGVRRFHSLLNHNSHTRSMGRILLQSACGGTDHWFHHRFL
jgi:hypothetical protein